MNGDLERRIRARAHAIWEQEGRPSGRAAAHWEAATAEVTAQDAVAAVEPAPTAKPRKAATRRATSDGAAAAAAGKPVRAAAASAPRASKTRKPAK